MQESSQGRREDLLRVAQIVQEEASVAQGGGRVSRAMKRVAEECPVEMVKFHRGIEVLAKHLVVDRRPLRQLEWRPWQADLASALSVEPDDRHIMWVKDLVGNKGKSTFVTHYVADPANDAIVLEGRVVDMAYLYDKQRVVFFDITRTQVELLDHLMSFAEKLKNGLLVSTKYMTQMKVFRPPHVVFFANVPCPPGKWSEDRVIAIDLD